jgi:putative intracellular protease/amidase
LKKGAIYLKSSVVVDGKIITACGPEAAKEFGEEILKLLKK